MSSRRCWSPYATTWLASWSEVSCRLVTIVHWHAAFTMADNDAAPAIALQIAGDLAAQFDVPELRRRERQSAGVGRRKSQRRSLFLQRRRRITTFRRQGKKVLHRSAAHDHAPRR